MAYGQANPNVVINDPPAKPTRREIAKRFITQAGDADLIPQLKPTYREIIAAADALDYDGIAAQLGLKLGSVKSRLNRARGALVKLREAAKS